MNMTARYHSANFIAFDIANSRGSYGQNRHFSARGLGAKRVIGGGSTICKEAETILKYNFGLISHVIITCAF